MSTEYSIRSESALAALAHRFRKARFEHAGFDEDEGAASLLDEALLRERRQFARHLLAPAADPRGENVMESTPPPTEQYDSRILKINPAAIGLAQNEDWVLSARPGPGGGLSAP